MNRVLPFSIGASLFWRQVLALTLANLKSRYRKTVAGFVWVVMNPILMYSVQCYIFHWVLRLEIAHYQLFLLGGLLPWIFIVQSLEMATPALVNSGRLLKSFPTNPLIFVFAQILDNAINFCAAFLCVLLPLAFFKGVDPWGVACLPIAAVLLFSGALAIVWALSVANVFFRDTRFIVSFVLAVLYFLTPIFYPVELVPASIRWLVQLNPLYLMVRPFQTALIQFVPLAFARDCAGSAAVSVAGLPLAAAYWKRKKNEIYLHL